MVAKKQQNKNSIIIRTKSKKGITLIALVITIM